MVGSGQKLGQSYQQGCSHGGSTGFDTLEPPLPLALSPKGSRLVPYPPENPEVVLIV